MTTFKAFDEDIRADLTGLSLEMNLRLHCNNLWVCLVKALHPLSEGLLCEEGLPTTHRIGWMKSYSKSFVRKQRVYSAVTNSSNNRKESDKSNRNENGKSNKNDSVDSSNSCNNSNNNNSSNNRNRLLSSKDRSN